LIIPREKTPAKPFRFAEPHPELCRARFSEMIKEKTGSFVTAHRQRKTTTLAAMLKRTNETQKFTS